MATQTGRAYLLKGNNVNNKRTRPKYRNQLAMMYTLTNQSFVVR